MIRAPVEVACNKLSQTPLAIKMFCLSSSPIFHDQVNKCIEEINIMCNDFGGPGAVAIAQALHVSYSPYYGRSLKFK